MTQKNAPLRPAMTAIAAVIGMSATPGFAQEAMPTVTEAPTISPGTAPVGTIAPAQPEAITPNAAQTQAVPVTPVQTPLAQPTPTAIPQSALTVPVESTVNIEAPASTVEKSTPAPVVAAQPTVADQQRAAPRPSVTRTAPSPNPTASNTSTPAATAETQAVDADPVVGIPTTLTEENTLAGAGAATTVSNAQPDAAAMEAAINDSSGNDGLIWGGLAGVLGLGAVAAFMAGRRRKPSRTAPAPAKRVDPVNAKESIGPAPDSQPAFAPETGTSSAVTARQVAATPAGPNSFTVTRMNAPHSAAPRITRDMSGHERAIERMVAEAPSEQNPFLTRKNRLRRAHWIARQSQIRTQTGTEPIRRVA